MGRGLKRVKYFYIEGQCNPQKHYMVNLDTYFDMIKQHYIEYGNYLVIIKGKKYGKTTILKFLAERLKDEYIVIYMDSQKIDSEKFEYEASFVLSFIKMFSTEFYENTVKNMNELLQPLDDLKEKVNELSLGRLFRRLSTICENAPRPIVLMIDEADSNAANQVFLDFLSQLRGYYMDRYRVRTFQSVILASVNDVRNMQLKSPLGKGHRYNSPWNIAEIFHMDMSFSISQIMGMLEEYETDNQTGMDVEEVAKEIYQYTSGYPFLVSAICMILDETLPGNMKQSNYRSTWSKEGVEEAVKIILKANTPLIEDMVGQLEIHKDLRDMVEAVLCQGRWISFCPDIEPIEMGMTIGLLKEKDGQVIVSNRIFEIRLMDLLD